VTQTGPEEAGYWRDRYSELEETLGLMFEAFAESLEARTAPIPRPASPLVHPPLDDIVDGSDHVVPSGDARDLRISVIVPCSLSVDSVKQCVDTLVAQTLPHRLFEAIFVFHGPDANGYERARGLLPGADLHHQLVRSSGGPAAALNTGASVARAPWVTILDVHDRLSPTYLEALLDSASSAFVVPLAGIVDVDVHGLETEPALHQHITRHRGVIDPTDLIEPLTISALKLIPTEVMLRHPLDTTRRDGSGSVHWIQVFEDEGLSFDTTPAFEGAR
jgi:hypothetical protein